MAPGPMGLLFISICSDKNRSSGRSTFHDFASAHPKKRETCVSQKYLRSVRELSETWLGLLAGLAARGFIWALLGPV